MRLDARDIVFDDRNGDVSSGSRFGIGLRPRAGPREKSRTSNAEDFHQREPEKYLFNVNDSTVKVRNLGCTNAPQRAQLF